jgi:aspartate 1-decarboxylase
MEHYEPRVVHVDRDNSIIDVDSAVATLLTPEA